jgi:hypothetical protein
MFMTESEIDMFQLQRYTAKMGGCVNLSSDMLKLYARTKGGIMHHEDSSILAG